MATSRGSSRTSGFPIQTSPQFVLRNHALQGEHTIVTIVTKGTSMTGGVTDLRQASEEDSKRLLQDAPPVMRNRLAGPVQISLLGTPRRRRELTDMNRPPVVRIVQCRHNGS